MNRTQALAIASRAVSLWGRGTRWTVSHPWDRTDPAGPSTTYSCNSYAQARLSAARTRARVALALLGQYNHDTECTLSQRAGSARDLVRAALDECPCGECRTRQHSFRRVVYNGTPGWIATRREHGIFVGTAFGVTRAAAVAAFSQPQE